jgi:recombinase-like zinc beta ribbon protein
VRAPAHLLSGIATCPKCGRGLHYRRHASDRADSYGCVKGPAGCGGTAIKAGLLEEYVTGAVLDALESPRVQEALRAGEDQHAPRRADLLAQIRDAPGPAGRGPPGLCRPCDRPGRLAGYPAARRG